MDMPLKRLKNASLLIKLSAVIFLIVLLVFTGIMPPIIFRVDNYLEKNMKDQIIHLSEVIDASIRAEAKRIRDYLEIIINTPDINRVIKADDYKELERVLRSVTISLDIDGIGYIDEKGNTVIITNIPDVSSSENFKHQISKREFIDRSFIKFINGKPFIVATVSSPIWSKGFVIFGIKSFEIPSMKVEGQLGEFGIEIYDSEGREISYKGSTLARGIEKIDDQIVKSIFLEKTQILRKNKIKDTTYLELFNPLILDNHIYGIYSIRFPYEKISSIKKKIIISIIIFGIMGISLILGLVYMFTGWITRRINVILEATQEIAKGRLGYQIPEQEKDEIGKLVESFNRMSTGLKQGRLDWERTFRSMQEAISILDLDGRIREVNESFTRMFGNHTDQLKGMSIYKVLSFINTNDHPVRKCTITEREEEIEVYDKANDRWLWITATPVIDESGEILSIIQTVRDITTRKRSEKLINRQIRHLRALHNIEKAINADLDLKSTLNLLTEEVISQFNIDAAAVLLYKKTSGTLEFTVSKGFNTDALRYTRLSLGEGNAGRAVRERKIIYIEDLKNNNHGFERSEHFLKEGFVSYVAIPLIARGSVKGVLELYKRSKLDLDSEEFDLLETIGDQAAIAIDNALLFSEVERSRNELIMAYDSMILGLSSALDMRDKETEGHSQRVTIMTVMIAQEMGINDDRLIHIRRGALLHDIGKIGIPDSILLKPGKLTEEERKIMEQHPVIAYNMLKDIDYLRPALDIPYCHHEKWDGTGYPRGLKGKEIPIAARIFAVVDVWDALLSDRPYRSAWPRERVLEYIKSQAGKHFDPDVIPVFLRIESREYTRKDSTISQIS